jgi:hypothetical protein
VGDRLGPGSLYISGHFTAVSGVTARNVAKWDGQRWSSLGTGDENGARDHDDDGRHRPDVYPSEVRALAVTPNGDIYVGGVFDRVGQVVVIDLARWDGHRWNSVSNFLHLEESIH